MQELVFFCEKLVEHNRQVFILKGFYMVKEWFTVFNMARFYVMPPIYMFLYITDTAPNRHITEFSKKLLAAFRACRSIQNAYRRVCIQLQLKVYGC